MTPSPITDHRFSPVARGPGAALRAPAVRVRLPEQAVMTLEQFRELVRWLQQYGFDPYNSDCAGVRMAVCDKLGLSLD